MKLTPFLLLMLLASTRASAAQAAAAPESEIEFSLVPAERPGDGRQVCGLGKRFHAGRRAELMRRFPEDLLVFRGLTRMRENVAFRQDKTFWYLTGIESEKAALLLDSRSGRQILFLPERTKRLEMMERWEGEKWDSTDEWIGELSGFEEIRTNDPKKNEGLLAAIEELLGDRKKIGASFHPTIVMAGSYDTASGYDSAVRNDTLDSRMTRQEALEKALEERFEVDVFDVTGDLIEMRQVKEPEEIDALRRAGRAGAVAMSEAMRSTAPGRGEWELEGLMSYVQISAGAEGPGYSAIVGSGGNSCVLHYTVNNRVMQDGEVLLIDFGPEVDHYVTDITRTWPVNGKFTPRQAELYDAVLAAQQAAIDACKPGATIGELSKITTDVFKELGIDKKLILHGPCHFVGMEVHDPGLYQQPFEPGVAFTIEPGLYDTETGIGIRIEDVIVITEDGYEIVTAGCPRARPEVEAMVQSQGFLD